MPPLDPLLRRLAGRYRWVEGWERFAARVWLAPLAALAILVAARLWPLAAERAWALGLGLGLLAGLALVAWRRRISLPDAARRCDRDLGLADRLATAHALSGELAAAEADGGPTPRLLLLRRQREDAWRRVQGLDPRAFIHPRTPRRPALAFVILSVAALVMAILPNPQHAVLAERRQQQRAAAALAQELRRQEEALRQTGDPAQPPDEARLEAAEALARLARRLEDSRGQVEADLAALAEAEEALRQAQDPAKLSQGAEAQALARRLEGLAADAEAAAAASDAGAEAGSGEDAAASTSPVGPGEDAAAPPAADSEQGASSLSAAGAGQTARQALERLAAAEPAAAGAGGAERRALAQELRAAAADSLLGDGAAASGLENLAQALESGDEKAAEQAAAEVAEAVEAAEQAAAGAQALEQALGSLDEGRRSLARAGAAAASATGGAGESGAPGEAGGEARTGARPEAGAEGASRGGTEGTAGGEGGEGGAEAGAGAEEQGTAGQGREGGQAAEGGSSVGSKSPAASAGASGSAGAPGGGAGRGAVAAELVYADPRRLGEAGERSFVPGQAGQDGGTFRQVPARQPGLGAAGRVPFAQVLPAYREGAARALDRAQVPAARRDYVRAYFAQLEE